MSEMSLVLAQFFTVLDLLFVAEAGVSQHAVPCLLKEAYILKRLHCSSLQIGFLDHPQLLHRILSSCFSNISQFQKI